MRILGIGWLGSRTPAYESMAEFATTILGLDHAGQHRAARQLRLQDFGVAQAVLETDHDRAGLQHAGQLAAGLLGAGRLHRDQHESRVARALRVRGETHRARREAQVRAEVIGEVQAVLADGGGWDALVSHRDVRSNYDPEGIAPFSRPGRLPKSAWLDFTLNGSNYITRRRAWDDAAHVAAPAAVPEKAPAVSRENK